MVQEDCHSSKATAQMSHKTVKWSVDLIIICIKLHSTE